MDARALHRRAPASRGSPQAVRSAKTTSTTSKASVQAQNPEAQLGQPQPEIQPQTGMGQHHAEAETKKKILR